MSNPVALNEEILAGLMPDSLCYRGLAVDADNAGTGWYRVEYLSGSGANFPVTNPRGFLLSLTVDGNIATQIFIQSSGGDTPVLWSRLKWNTSSRWGGWVRIATASA